MKRRSPPLPIEKLSDATWDRIERKVFDELSEGTSASPEVTSKPLSKRSPRVIVWAAAALALLGVAATLLRSPDDEALGATRMVTAQGDAETLVGDASLRLGPETAFTVVGGERSGRVVVIERGRIDFAVPPRRQRPPFVVQAGDVRVEVVGTQFVVERHGDAVSVEVREGTVRVVARGHATMLTAGTRFELGSAAGTHARTQEVESEKVGTVGTEGYEGPEERASKRSRRARSSHSVRDATSEAVTVAPSRAAPSRGDAASTDSRLDASQRFERASRLERGDQDEAIAIYRSIAAEGGPWAANARFAAGRLELERGRPAAARRWLEEYLGRHPDGPNAEDARALLRQMQR